jgi:hypothetical protein
MAAPEEPRRKWRGKIVAAVIVGVGLLRLFEMWVQNGGRL